MRASDEQVWMVLGHCEREGATVAVVVGATDAHAAKACYQRAFPHHTPISWPRLADLKQSVATMEDARDGKDVDLCPVLVVSDKETVDGAAAPNPAATIPCPVHVIKALGIIQACLRKHRMPDPFENNAEAYSCGAFEAVAQKWQPFEEPGLFRWRDIEIRWYKHLYRETTISRTMAGDEVAEMIAECRAAIELETLS